LSDILVEYRSNINTDHQNSPFYATATYKGHVPNASHKKKMF